MKAGTELLDLERSEDQAVPSLPNAAPDPLVTKEIHAALARTAPFAQGVPPATRPGRDRRILVAGVVTLLAGVAMGAGTVWLRMRPRRILSNDPRAPPLDPSAKKDVALAILATQSMFVYLDPRRPGVLVPKQFGRQSQLMLQVGRTMAIPIPDLDVSDAGITATLSFSRHPFLCQIPWPAVYALVGEDGQGGVWSEDVPPEIAAAH
jgi:hypothetical protein